jgi:hypothetical protein
VVAPNSRERFRTPALPPDKIAFSSWAMTKLTQFSHGDQTPSARLVWRQNMTISLERLMNFPQKPKIRVPYVRGLSLICHVRKRIFSLCNTFRQGSEALLSVSGDHTSRPNLPALVEVTHGRQATQLVSMRFGMLAPASGSCRLRKSQSGTILCWCCYSKQYTCRIASEQSDSDGNVVWSMSTVAQTLIWG